LGCKIAGIARCFPHENRNLFVKFSVEKNIVGKAEKRSDYHEEEKRPDEPVAFCDRQPRADESTQRIARRHRQGHAPDDLATQQEQRDRPQVRRQVRQLCVGRRMKEVNM
jgi:hypothetical protein